MPQIGIGFDFDHTLGTDYGLERQAFIDLGREYGSVVDPHDDNVKATIERILVAFRSDETTLDEAVSEFLDAFGIASPRDGRVAGERYRQLCYGLVPRVKPITGAQALLAELERRAIPFAILTNGWSPLQEKKIAAIGYAGRVLVSDRIGYLKPAPQAFERLSETLEVSANRCWYVGDNPRADIGGALAAGMRAIWLDLGEHGYPSDVPPPSLRITSLEALIDELPAFVALAEGTDGLA